MKHKTSHCVNCKEVFLNSLLKIDPQAAKQYKNPIPNDLHKLSPHLKKIHKKLISRSKEDNRGPDGNLLSDVSFRPFDYFLPKYGCFVEFDESQHFTSPRLKSFELYPENIILGFDKAEWMQLCKDLNQHDPDPPYREEQRAWLDTVRDLGPQYHSEFFENSANIGPTIRIYEGEMEFCGFAKKTEEFIWEKINQFCFNK